MKQGFFLKNAKKLAKKYAGRYIAVANNKIIAVSKSRLDAYKKAVRKLPSKQTLGIYYLPKPEELLSALWKKIFHHCRGWKSNPRLYVSASCSIFRPSF